MKNVKTIVNNYNSRILNEERSVNSRTCNCCNKSKGPLKGRYLNQNIVYEGLIMCNQPHYQDKVYFGIVKTSLKQRYSNHP